MIWSVWEHIKVSGLVFPTSIAIPSRRAFQFLRRQEIDEIRCANCDSAIRSRCRGAWGSRCQQQTKTECDGIAGDINSRMLPGQLFVRVEVTEETEISIDSIPLHRMFMFPRHTFTHQNAWKNLLEKGENIVHSKYDDLYGSTVLSTS